MDDDNFLKFLKLLQPMAEQLKYGLIYSEIMNGDDEAVKSLVKSIQKIAHKRDIPFMTLFMAVVDLGVDFADSKEKGE